MLRKLFAPDSAAGLLRALLRPAVHRRQAWLIIAALMALVCLIDLHAPLEVALSAVYLPTILLATAWLGRGAGVKVALVEATFRIVVDIVIVYPEPVPWFSPWNAVGALFVYLLIVWLLDALLIIQHQLERDFAATAQRLDTSNTERLRLERELLALSARERHAFGRELHDDLGQHFVATALAAQVLAQSLDEGRGAKEARAIVRWIEEGTAKVRKMARGLLLDQIDPAQLPRELEELALATTQAGVPCRALYEGPPLVISPETCAQLFRITQEAVANALRHARAHAIHLTLDNRAHSLWLTITDDGCGLPKHDRPVEGVGLRIMEHRAELIGAKLSIVSPGGPGTTVTCLLDQSPARTPHA